MAAHPIPLIQCLLTFEAVARLRSAGKAADGLCVTPSASSHRNQPPQSATAIGSSSRTSASSFSAAPMSRSLPMA